jgi:GntR family transcriptional regulator
MATKSRTSQRLHDVLGRIIQSMEPGARLPSEPDLSRQLSVSRATLREAMRTFETQGLIHRRQGSGTFVSRPSQVIESGLELLESIETLASRIGLPVSTGEIKIEVRLASEREAASLDIPEGSQVTSVSRVIMAEEKPAAFLIDVLPVDILTPEDIQEDFGGSVLDFLMSRNDPSPTSSRCEIRAVTASPEISRYLAIQRGDVLLCFEALLFSANGRILDYSFSYFLPGHFRFHVVRRVGEASRQLGVAQFR